MGLTIFYSGRFNPESSLQEMIEEVKDICEVQNWKYKIFNKEFPVIPFPEKYDGQIYGICFTPPECETVKLEFLSNGRMSCSALLHMWGSSENKDHKRYIYSPWTKTQFAGYQVHALIIQIFRYVSKKYLLDFKVDDEGHYWKTNDIEVHKERFRVYENLLDNFCLGLQAMPVKKGENMEEYLVRVMEEVQKLKNKKK